MTKPLTVHMKQALESLEEVFLWYYMPSDVCSRCIYYTILPLANELPLFNVLHLPQLINEHFLKRNCL